ncbi:hypothetical protein THRCLA_23084 [Thraustotheca clavata]|uniref:Uncharacterized protein n=1 Tax=Thraustotheca clavata TaxID=74557 RepID=A0A1V9YF51_9STRA|nr:hypothetical protein THRCLA_23084 [Thraustotheca clavata]
MMVPSLDQQAPDIMVIDEIGRPNAVEAARKSKQRGMRVIATAYGDLRKLLKNEPLRSLVDGGAGFARYQKANCDRSIDAGMHCDQAIFEVIIELRRGHYDTWKITLDSARAVHDILAGQEYQVQLRRRSKLKNAIQCFTGKA